MTVGQRCPEAVLHHSDQGTQYTSLAFGKRRREMGVRPLTGSAGDCYDNAMGTVSQAGVHNHPRNQGESPLTGSHPSP